MENGFIPRSNGTLIMFNSKLVLGFIIGFYFIIVSVWWTRLLFEKVCSSECVFIDLRVLLLLQTYVHTYISGLRHYLGFQHSLSVFHSTDHYHLKYYATAGLNPRSFSMLLMHSVFCETQDPCPKNYAVTKKFISKRHATFDG